MVKTSRTSKALALSIATVCSNLLSIVQVMVLARVYNKVDLAIFKQTFLVFTTVLPLFGLGFASSLYYLLEKHSGKEDEILKKCTVMLLLSGVVFSVFVLLGGNVILAKLFGNPDLASSLLYLIPYTPIMLVGSIIPPVLIYHDRITLNAAYNVISHLLIAVLVIGVALAFSAEVNAAVFANVIAHIIGVVVIVIILFTKVLKVNLRSKQDKKDEISYKSILFITLPLALSAIIGKLDAQTDKWIVSILKSPEEFAVFANGAFQLPFISSITGAIAAVIVVDMTRAAKNKEYEDALALFLRVARMTSAVIFPLMMLMLVTSDYVIEILYSKEYLASVPVFQVYLLYLPVRAVYYGPLIIALGRSKSMVYKMMLALLVNVVLSVVLVELIGSIGAAVATILSVYIVNIPYNIRIISSEMKCKWYRVLPLKDYLRYLLLSLPATLAAYLVVRFISGELHVILKFGAAASVFCLVQSAIYLRYFKLTPKAALQMAKKKLFKKKKGSAA